MRVSWIDADRIKALVAQIDLPGPCSQESSQVVEVQTEPRAGFMEGESVAMEVKHVSIDSEYEFPPVESRPTLSVPAPALTTSQREPRPKEPSPPESDYGQSPLHNSAAALPLSRIRDKLRAIRQRASDAGILARGSDVPAVWAANDEAAVPNSAKASAPTEEDLPQVLELVIPHASREERLSAFGSWARQVLRDDGGHVLVMNDDGEVLWGGEAKAGLVLSTMMAWGAAMRASTLPTTSQPVIIRQSLSSGQVLTVIPCHTAHGLVHATVVGTEGLSDKQADVLRGGLCSVMAESPSSVTV